MVRSRSQKRRKGIRERLGQLTYRAACRLMGDEDGEARLRRGGLYDIDPSCDVYLGGDTLRVSVPDPGAPEGRANVIVTEMAAKPKGLHLHCEVCNACCDHIAAVLGMVLEEKLTLGLAAPPDPSEPIELLTEDELMHRAWPTGRSAPPPKR